jgi:hypothetical protein
MLAAVVMGPTALTPAELVETLADSPSLRVALWALWVGGTAPAVRAAIVRPELFALRAMPIAPATWWLCLAAIAVAVQLPWAAVAWAGGGAAAGLATALAAAGLGTAFSAAGVARAADRAVSLGCAALLAALIVAAAPSWAIAAAGAATLAVTVPPAWKRAPEMAAARRGARVWRASFAPLALATYHALGLWRRDTSALTRAAILSAAGGILAGLVQAELAGALVVGALTLTAAVFGLAAPIARCRREASWLLDSTGTGPLARAAGAGLAATAIGIAAGAGQAAITALAASIATDAAASSAPRPGAMVASAASIAGGSAVRVIAPILLGLALGVAAVPVASWADRPTGVDGTLVAAAGLAVILFTIVAVVILHR